MKGMPPGRKSIKTLCYTGDKRREVYAGMVRQIKAGHQAYIVCAVIEPGEMPGVRAAAEVYEELQRTFLKDILRTAAWQNEACREGSGDGRFCCR